MIALVGDRAPALCVLIVATQHCDAQPRLRAGENRTRNGLFGKRPEAKQCARLFAVGSFKSPHDEDDSQTDLEEPFAVNTILVFTLAVGASLNAWCLSAFL